ncbi:MAG: DUF393 domain-containing protein [Armatimonadetes bacterium]|nr:DUF393 domain-containing protein [Armatimonadota bacterium]
MTSSTAREGAFTLFYDGECPFCAREIALLRKLDRRGRLGFENIARPEFDPRRFGMTLAEFVSEFRGVGPDGVVTSGMETLRRAYAAVGLGWLLAFTGWGLFRPAADAGYRFYARHRLRWGRWLGTGCAGGSCSIRF